MSLLKLAAAGSSVVEAKLYVDDVFSTYLYTGNGSTQDIVNGIDGDRMVWTKGRSAAHWNLIHDTARGATKYLTSNAAYAQATRENYLTSFNSNGFSLGAGADVNTSPETYVSWTFRNAPKFFHHQQVIKSAGSNATVDLSSLGTVGMVKVKRTDAAGSWYVWHRSLTPGKLLIGETNASEATLGHITVSGTTLTLVNGVIADGTYHIEAYAHDDSADGLIQCGSYVGNGTVGQNIELGWEFQFLIVKGVSYYNWNIIDVMRGSTHETAANYYARSNRLFPENSDGESLIYDFAPIPSGFKLGTRGDSDSNSGGSKYIYLAIRRPNKPPTSGEQVYKSINRAGTAAVTRITSVGFPPDLCITKMRELAVDPLWRSRLQGAPQVLVSSITNAEQSNIGILSFDQLGVTYGLDNSGSYAVGTNTETSKNYINHFFKRAPGVFDIVCYPGTGVAHSEAHSLGVVPELMLVKNRTDGTSHWATYNKVSGATKWQILNATNADMVLASIWNNTIPTDSSFSVGTNVYVNTAPNTYVAYLFATKTGISKVGSYSGNGSTQTIDCGFTTGARFILIKRTDSTGDWYMWDSVRGIVAANDPHISLNTTAAEVTTDDSVDPHSSGFIVNQNAATNINVSGGSYIYLSYA